MKKTSITVHTANKLVILYVNSEPTLYISSVDRLRVFNYSSHLLTRALGNFYNRYSVSKSELAMKTLITGTLL